MKTKRKDEETKAKELRQSLARYHLTYTSAIQKEFGKIGTDVLKKALKDLGTKTAEGLLQEGFVKRKGLKGFIKYLVDLAPTTGFMFEITEPDGKTVILRVKHCPYESVWKKMKASREVCEVLCKVDEGMAEAFCRRPVRLTLTSNILEGSTHCDYVFVTE